MRRAAASVVALALLVAACGQPEADPTVTTTSTSAGSSTTLPVSTTTGVVTTTAPVPGGNPWAGLLGEVSAPMGWTVAPCDGEAPLLCIVHDGTTSTVRLERTAVDGSEFAALLAEAGAPPDTTDLGAAAALPSVRAALRALADREFESYAEKMAKDFPDWPPTFEAPAVVAMGRSIGYRFGMRIEDGNAFILAWSIRHVAFDGETLWEVTADFDFRSPAEGFADLVTLQEMDLHLTQMMRSLALGPTLPGTLVTTMALPEVGEVTPGWHELFAIPYGEAVGQLGTSPGGDNGTLDLGPEFGAQAHDGTWWFLDGAKKRLAHYTAEGAFLDAVEVPAEYLVRGELFQWQLPHALDDGTLVASRLGQDDTTLLVLRDGRLSSERVPQAVSVKVDDGAAIYGLARNGEPTRIDAATGAAESVDWFVTRGGTRFQVWVARNVITLWLPDAPLPNTHQLQLVYEPDPADPVYVGLEAAGGSDGSLYLYLQGGTASGAGGQLGGFLTVSPDGTIDPIEVTRQPDVRSDPGSPAHLGTVQMGSEPWLMFVDQDAVRVLVRSGA